MASVNDIYQVVTLGYRGPTAIRNVFFYKALASACNAIDLVDQFVESVVNDLLECVGDHYAMEQIYCESKASNTDFINYQFSSPQAGKRSQPYASDIMCVAFQSPSKVKGIRPGQKRIGPLALSMVNANTVTSSSVELARLANLATGLGLTLANEDTIDIASPIIVKRTYDGLVNGRRSYSIPTQASNFNSYVADNWGFKTILTSQVSRKAGRGE